MSQILLWIVLPIQEQTLSHVCLPSRQAGSELAVEDKGEFLCWRSHLYFLNYFFCNQLRHHRTTATSTFGRYTHHSLSQLSIWHPQLADSHKPSCLRISTCVQGYLFLVTISTMPSMQALLELNALSSICPWPYVSVRLNTVHHAPIWLNTA